MQETHPWLATALLIGLIAMGATTVAAEEPDYADVSAYILQAEMALQREDYLMAVREYGKAAELSDNPDVARQAAATGMAFGFDEEAGPNAIEVYVSRLRKKLEPAGVPIRTIRGLGYLLEAP